MGYTFIGDEAWPIQIHTITSGNARGEIRRSILNLKYDGAFFEVSLSMPRITSNIQIATLHLDLDLTRAVSRKSGNSITENVLSSSSRKNCIDISHLNAFCKNELILCESFSSYTSNVMSNFSSGFHIWNAMKYHMYTNVLFVPYTCSVARCAKNWDKHMIELVHQNPEPRMPFLLRV